MLTMTKHLTNFTLSVLTVLFILTTQTVSGQHVKADSILTNEIQKKIIKNYNIKYPKLAVENEIQGTVTISYDIDSTCSIVNRKVVTGLGYGCDEATFKVLNDFQKDMKKEKNSNCKPSVGLTLSLVFKLD